MADGLEEVLVSEVVAALTDFFVITAGFDDSDALLAELLTDLDTASGTVDDACCRLAWPRPNVVACSCLPDWLIPTATNAFNLHILSLFLPVYTLIYIILTIK